MGTSADSATVVDNAGNAATATVQFTVIVTFDSLCSLTQQFLSKPQLSTALCGKLAQAKAARNSTTKINQLDAFENQVSAQSGKAMTTGAG